MKRSHKLAEVSNAILWAVAIITSALIGNSSFLTTIILPILALMSISNSVYFNNKDSKANDQTDHDS
ncbi:MAG: hypothetical protein ACI9N9_002425 [Enterobacterales bacterium]|jgi:hypothetical protein